MKFTIAVGILTQVLPAISENNPSKRLEQEGDFVILNNNDHHSDQDFASPKSLFHKGNNARVRRGMNTHQRLEGLLKNVPVANMKACDPSSTDPDIGILSCDAGYECVPDQYSTLGGLCSSISRDLQTPLYLCDACGNGYTMAYVYLNNPVLGSAIPGQTCAGLYILAYIAGTPQNYCPYLATQATLSGCCVAYYCSLCGEGGELLSDVVTNYLSRAQLIYTCGGIEPTLNATYCEIYAPKLAPTCCAGATVPAPAPVVSPTSTSVGSPTATSVGSPTSTSVGSPPPTLTSVGNPPPTLLSQGSPAPPASASVGKWSTSPLVIMCLAVVTAGSLLALN